MANRTPRTKEELQKEKEKLQSEISRLEKIIEASSNPNVKTHAFGVGNYH